jgi:hypothetical protein
MSNFLRSETGKTQYYWYSTGQAEVLSGQHQRYVQHFDRPTTLETYTHKPLYIKGNQGKFDGIVHEYTEVTETPEPSGDWKDYALVAIMTPEAMDKLIAELEITWP